MKRRFRMALPLLFAFVLTLMPFGLLEYNQRQRAVIRHERELLQWEHKAGNYLQMFKSLWSIEQQIKYRQYMFKKARLRAGLTKNYSGRQFLADLQTVFSHKLQPEVIYAGIYQPATGVKMFSGPGFANQKQRFFARILESLVSTRTGATAEISSLSNMVRGAFGDVLDFNLLKNHRRGKVSRVMFEGRMRLLFWDAINAADGSILVSLQLFPPGNSDRLALMKRVANYLSVRNPEICSVLVPLEFSGSGNVPVFDSYVPFEQRQRLLSLFEKMREKPLERDHLVPAGKFVDYHGVRIYRDFIDYAVPFEVWVLSRENPEVKVQEPVIGFLLRLSFFAGWVLVFCRVLITGSPIGVSLKNWLTMTFIVVGILPLAVFFVAGIFQIDSTLFRREQEAVKDALQRLEEADASGEVIMNEFRDACRNWTREPEWANNIASWSHDAWKVAVEHVQRKFLAAGLKIGAVYIYPPDRAGVESQCFVLPDKDNSEDEEQRTHEFYLSWVRKAYFKLSPELMDGTEPEMSVFHGRTGQEILRIFLSNRGDTEFVDLDDEKQVIYQNYILADGRPCNWYFFRFDVARIFEDYLRETVKSLQDVHSENFYAIILFDRNETRFAFPVPGSKEAGLIEQNAGRMIDFAAVTRSQLIEHNDDKLVVTYPCVKSGASILVNIVYFTALRAAAYRQELLLSLAVLLMTFPVVLISRMTAGYLVNPLLRVEAGLKKIADEDYSVKLQLNRDDELGVMTASFDQMVEGLKERRNLGRFVSATLNQQVSHTENEENSGLENRFGAVLCSDIRSFTSISEANQVRDVVEMLNEHLAAMSECIRASGGLVEQFVGDAVLAVFHGNSLEIASKNAVRAAVAMMRKHHQICQQRSREGKFVYSTGVGIEAGLLLSGTITAGSRNDYMVVGVARNAAEELEIRSKEGLYTRIIVSPQVFQLVDGYKFVLHGDGENYELAELEEKS